MDRGTMFAKVAAAKIYYLETMAEIERDLDERDAEEYALLCLEQNLSQAAHEEGDPDGSLPPLDDGSGPDDLWWE